MDTIKLVLIGGFLGSGKTTLLAETAKRLVERGSCVGLITNDQASDLVDTAFLKQRGLPVTEVGRGCFCCRFDALIAAAEELVQEHAPVVILGEPVGSCTDLSATVLQPVKKLLAERFRLAPYSVLIDPFRLHEIRKDDVHHVFPDTVHYIYRTQLEEADLLILNKTDLLDQEDLSAVQGFLKHRFPGIPVFSMSALTGQGLEGWLDYMLGDHPAGGENNRCGLR